MVLGGRSVLAVALAVALVLALVPGAASGADRRARADLVLKSVKVEPTRSPQYSVIGQDTEVRFRVKVANIGEAATRADGKLRIVAVLDDEVMLPVRVIDFHVRRLRPGRSHTVPVTERLLPLQGGLGLGRYQNRACVASRKDRRGRNNCRSGKPFSVIPEHWNGSADMTAVVDADAKEHAHAQVGFGFLQAQPGGFVYAPNPAVDSVEYSTSGTDSDGCAWSGGAELSVHPQTRLRLGVDNSWYGIASLAAGGYGITITCPGEEPFGFAGPVNSFWIDTLPRSVKLTTDTRLSDTRNLPGVGITYEWTLVASPLP